MMSPFSFVTFKIFCSFLSLSILFIYLELCWVFIAALRLFLVAESGGYSLVVVCRLLTAVASPVKEQGLWGLWASAVAAHELSSCSSWALGHKLNSCATVDLWHAGSSWIRD